MVDNLHYFYTTNVFKDVALSGLFADGKRWADAMPINTFEEVEERYNSAKLKSDFCLASFVECNFKVIDQPFSIHKFNINKDIDEHILSLWSVLRRNPDALAIHNTKLPLPYPYIVPGGRFDEIYYWDSYFTMLGLVASGYITFAYDMLLNFKHLIAQLGFIPNGNRSYFTSRSQPPFFAAMVELMAKYMGESIYKECVVELRKEYDWWWSTHPISVCRLDNGQISLLGYWDQASSPRIEMYREDVDTAKRIPTLEDQEIFFRHIRSACESGWDFSSRWLRDPMDFISIQTNNIIPVDLNCLIAHMEKILSKSYSSIGDVEQAQLFRNKAERRQAAIDEIFFDNKTGFFGDIYKDTLAPTGVVSAAGVFPLAFGFSSEIHAASALKVLERELLKAGGICTTTVVSGQQWDAPNGWAPLQWMACVACIEYGNADLAQSIIHRWMSLNQKVYLNTGKMMEKYNVVDVNVLSGGGEYPVQDGFGWTNGVYLAFQKNVLHVL